MRYDLQEMKGIHEITICPDQNQSEEFDWIDQRELTKDWGFTIDRAIYSVLTDKILTLPQFDLSETEITTFISHLKDPRAIHFAVKLSEDWGHEVLSKWRHSFGEKAAQSGLDCSARVYFGDRKEYEANLFLALPSGASADKRAAQQAQAEGSVEPDYPEYTTPS